MALLCFDLDGPLVDPLEALEASFRIACAERGVPCPTRTELAAHIGLNPAGLFPALPPADLAELLAGQERAFAEEGLYLQRVQPGIHALLARLKRQGHRLFLLADTRAALARQTLHHFDLLLGFDDVLGLRPGEPWRGKRDLLERLRQDGFLRSGGYAIGDRAEDVLAARALGLRALGVSYGFGSRRELQGAGAEFILDSVQDLDAWLEKALKDRERHDPFSRSE